MPRTVKTLQIFAVLASAWSSTAHAADPAKPHPYRLPSVNIKQPVIWGSTCEAPDGTALSFGGEDRDSDDGLAHTRLRVDGKWIDLREALAADPRQRARDRIGELREHQKDVLAHARSFYFLGYSKADSPEPLILRRLIQHENRLAGAVSALAAEVDRATAAGDDPGGVWKNAPPLARAKAELEKIGGKLQAGGVTPDVLTGMREVQVQLEQTADAIAAEPPARALSPIVYESKSKLFVLFGGDHCDYLTNDTWVFDPAARKWTLRHPANTPPPRANHTWKAIGDGKLALSGGYTYFSNTDYMGGQYIELADGDWTYDVAKDTWTGSGKSAPAGTRTYRAGPFLPEFFFDANVPAPDAAEFQTRLKSLPANVWTRTKPPALPQVNRDWGTAVLDPSRDLILRWSGGHCAHGGSDVLQYHLATNRWELCYPVEFPLGQLYDNTEYPGGWNFNHRPWISGHTYQNYGVDPNLKQMIFLGHSPWGYIYDPDRGDWTSRFALPRAMDYSGSMYTLTTTATPQGLVCWTEPGDVFLLDARGLTTDRGLSPFAQSAEQKGTVPLAPEWRQLKLTGEPLPGAVVDNSTVVYDSHRDRLLFVRKLYGNDRFKGEVYTLDLKNRRGLSPFAQSAEQKGTVPLSAGGSESFQVTHLSPAGKEHAGDLPYLCQLRYDAANDLLLVGGTLPPGPDGLRRTPAYDCAANKWISLKITGDDPSGREGRNVSLGLMYDAKRHLFWAVDTNSHVFVLRLDAASADVKEF